MPRKLPALCLLLVAAAFGQGDQSKQTNTLLAELITLGETKDDRPTLTASVRLTNKGAGYVSVLLVGRPSAVDDAGGVFDVQNVAGIAYCKGTDNPPSKIICVGKPKVDDRYLFPLENYTEIDPGQSAVFNVVMYAGRGSKGNKITLAQEVAYRALGSPDDNANGSVEDRLKRVRMASLNFNAAPGEVVTSTIRYNMDMK